MKTYLWKPSDIIAGRVVCKPSKFKFDANGWTAKHTYKIGWHAGSDFRKNEYALVALTDGMICKSENVEELVKRLNEGGFVPMKHKWMMKVMDYLKGCYDAE